MVFGCCRTHRHTQYACGVRGCVGLHRQAGRGIIATLDSRSLAAQIAGCVSGACLVDACHRATGKEGGKKESCPGGEGAEVGDVWVTPDTHARRVRSLLLCVLIVSVCLHALPSLPWEHHINNYLGKYYRTILGHVGLFGDF